MSNPKVQIEITSKAKQANAEILDTKKNLDALQSMAARAAGLLGLAGVGIATAGAVSAGLQYNTVLESQAVAFKTLLGSADAAARRMEDLADFAAATPFELPEIVNASKLLQSLTQGALASGDALRLVGDAAAVSGRSFEEVAMWVGRLYAGLESGTPVGEATLRLIEMGLMSGETARKLNSLAETAQSSQRAMEIIRETFSKTSGAMADMSQTMAGMQSTLADTMRALAADAVLPVWESLKNAVRGVLESLGAMPTALEAIGAASTGRQLSILGLGSAATEDARKANLAQLTRMRAEAEAALAGHRARLVAAQAEAESNARLPLFLGNAKGIALAQEKSELEDRITALQREINAMNAVAARLDTASAKAKAASGSADQAERAALNELGPTIFPGTYYNEVEARTQQALAAKQAALDLDSEDAFWVEQAKRDYAEQNRLIEQANREKERSVELAAEESRRRKEADYGRSYVGGTQQRWEDWQSSSAHDQDVGAGMIAGWQNSIMQLGTVAENAGRMIQNTIGGAINSVSQGITGLITGTMTWAQVLRQIGTSIIQTVIDGIVRMFTAWIMKRIAASAVEKASATSEAAAKAPGALMDSISSFGIAAAVGAAAFIAAMALAGGFREGGYTGDGPVDEVAGVVHRGEYVVPASVVQSLGVDRLSALTTMEAPASRPAGGGASERPLNIHLHHDRQAFLAAYRDDLEAIALDVYRRRSA